MISYGEIRKLLNFSDRSDQKKCCGTALVNREVALINIAQLNINIKINKKAKNIIIDFGTIKNFIIKKYAKNKRYFI